MSDIVVGQSVTAGQMKDFWRQVDDGSIGRDYLQDFLAHKLERKVERIEVTEPQVVISKNLRSTPPTLADSLTAREELQKFFSGDTIILRDQFILTEEELASTTLMPAFRPTGATNRMAVEWKMKMGEIKPYEEVDVMRYKNSKGLKDPELYLINRSLKPDKDTLGDNAKSPDDLIKVPNKLWLGLFGWCDADTLHHAITGEHLDPETWTWFPEDRLHDGRVAYGDWRGSQVRLRWLYAGGYDPYLGARSAKKVPLKH